MARTKPQRGRPKAWQLPFLIPVWIVGGLFALFAVAIQQWLRFEAPAWLRKGQSGKDDSSHDS
ncbi:MAG: hypothetical protein AAGM22_31265 [Acidobacteriota bacterium]